MALDTGFVKLHRSIINWEWYTDPSTKTLFLHLLLTVNIKKSNFQGHEISKGSRVCSYTSLAEETGLSVRNIRTAINHLKSTGEVTVSKTPKFSIISINNWSKYQHSDRVSDTGATGKRQHNKKKKEEEEYSLDTLLGVSKESEKHEKAVSQYADRNDVWD
jgi:hypothetical protein